MKVPIFYFFMLCFVNNAIGQNSIVGKWKPIKTSSPERGEMFLDEIKLRATEYKKTIEEKKGKSPTKIDSLLIENLVFITRDEAALRLNFNADSTFIMNYKGKTTTGNYIYDSLSKKVTILIKEKLPRVIQVSFESGLLKINITVEKVILYLEKFN
jgi:hypothetical protein